MRKKVLRPTTLATLLVAAFLIAGLAVSLLQQQGSAKSPPAGQVREKKPRDIARERDWETEGSSESHAEYDDFESLMEGADAIVYGRIIDSKSFWDETGNPIDHGENITTEYAVDIYRVLKDKTQSSPPAPDKAFPAPLTTPLKIARNGGVVYENGHRAEVKVKGYESLNQGKEYVFFLDWSPDYKAFILAGGASGAVMVDDDQSLRPLAKSKDIQEKLRGVDLHSFINELSLKRWK